MKSNATFGGVLAASVDHGAWSYHANVSALAALDKILSDWFGAGSPPTGFYLAPYKNATAPSSALTAATFAGTQGEYIDYVEATRGLWTPNGPSVNQVMSNSATPVEFTVGAAAVTLRGAALIASAQTKGATTGLLVACAAFTAPITLNPGSTISLMYFYGANPA